MSSSPQVPPAAKADVQRVGEVVFILSPERPSGVRGF